MRRLTFNYITGKMTIDFRQMGNAKRVWWYMRKKITHNRYLKSLSERKQIFWQMFSHFLKPNQELLRIFENNY